MLLERRFVYRLAAVCLFSLLAFAIEPVAAPAPNAYPAYQELRNIGLGGEAVSVSNETQADSTCDPEPYVSLRQYKAK